MTAFDIFALFAAGYLTRMALADIDRERYGWAIIDFSLSAAIVIPYVLR